MAITMTDATHGRELKLTRPFEKYQAGDVGFIASYPDKRHRHVVVQMSRGGFVVVQTRPHTAATTFDDWEYKV